jgi:hypothetical protein
VNVIVHLKTSDGKTFEQALVPGNTSVRMLVPEYEFIGGARFAEVLVTLDGIPPGQPDQSAQIEELEEKLEKVRALVCDHDHDREWDE